jgi:LysM repeat protein
MKKFLITRVAAALAVLALAAACGPQRNASTETYQPPKPLALVALVDPSPDRMPQQLQQLASVIADTATPGEAVVVMLLEPGYGRTYVVQRNDSLSSISAAHGLSLAAIEQANPQLGPLSGRDWKLIHPGETVIIPDGAAQPPLLVVSRAPDGPSLPQLVRVPAPPGNPTDFQKAEYNRSVAAANATNAQRIAAWQAAAQNAVKPWQQQMVAELQQKARSSVPQARPPDASMVGASMQAGLATLSGLDGRRLLLLLGGGDVGPTALPRNSMADVNVVVANLVDPSLAGRWTSVATTAGASSVKPLDPALTRLQLAQIVNT